MSLCRPLDRRTFLHATVGLSAVGLAAPAAAAPVVATRPIPSTGEALPVVGLGSWITFNVGSDPSLRAECSAVMRAFFAAGGRLIDSSPMYGSAEAVIGEGWASLGRPPQLFSATKVWTADPADGRRQIEESFRLWGVERFDLLQVHNLVAWREHLPTLRALKEQGRVRHLGITTSHGLRHPEVEAILRGEALDFVQLTLNPLDRTAEERLLPLAADRSVAVIVNRTFRQGALTRALAGVPLPGWARELGAESWAQAILAFCLAHKAVTCAIPATTRPEHARENLAAAALPLPDRALRERIARDVAAAL